MKRALLLAWLAAATSLAVAGPPSSVGPQGLMLWESPRDLPEISFENFDGESLTLNDFHGRSVLLNIWATWCGPCREEMPTLDSLQEELGGDDFEVVALSIDRKGIDVVNEFFDEVGIEHLERYIDQTGKAGTELGAVGIPTTLLLDPQGKEIGRLVGEAEWDTPEMKQFLKESIRDSSEVSP